MGTHWPMFSKRLIQMVVTSCKDTLSFIWISEETFEAKLISIALTVLNIWRSAGLILFGSYLPDFLNDTSNAFPVPVLTSIGSLVNLNLGLVQHKRCYIFFKHSSSLYVSLWDYHHCTKEQCSCYFLDSGWTNHHLCQERSKGIWISWN